jgi:hypothetical protein
MKASRCLNVLCLVYISSEYGNRSMLVQIRPVTSASRSALTGLQNRGPSACSSHTRIRMTSREPRVVLASCPEVVAGAVLRMVVKVLLMAPQLRHASVNAMSSVLVHPHALRQLLRHHRHLCSSHLACLTHLHLRTRWSLHQYLGCPCLLPIQWRSSKQHGMQL